MRTEVEDRGIFVKDLLRSVAVVHIPIDDEHFLYSFDTLQIPCGNRDIVEKTKPHSPVDPGMVAGWPDRAKGVVNCAGADRIGGGNSGAARKQGGFKRFFRNNGIRVDMLKCRPGKFLYRIYQVLCVNGLYVFTRASGGSDIDKNFLETGLIHRRQ